MNSNYTTFLFVSNLYVYKTSLLFSNFGLKTGMVQFDGHYTFYNAFEKNDFLLGIRIENGSRCSKMYDNSM